MKEEPAAVKLHNMPKRVTVTFVKYCGVMVVNIYIPIAAKTKATVTQNGKKKEFSTNSMPRLETVGAAVAALTACDKPIIIPKLCSFLIFIKDTFCMQNFCKYCKKTLKN